MKKLEEQQHRNALPYGFQLNEYQIKSVLGKPGGFGITYLATDIHLRQLVAIKEYLPTDFAIREGVSTVYVRSSSDEASFQWGLKCFIEEARVLAKFNHHHIVKVLRFFETNGTAYMVMEYQRGKSLSDYLKQKQTLTEEELLTIIFPLLDGLSEIHKAGILHRDIKPNNIYIRDDNTPVLLDFGSARYRVGQHTRSVTSIVTPGYAPLEQYDNDMKEQGPWTDIYALGGVMYCAISGETPPAATRRVMKDPIVPAIKRGKNKYNSLLLKTIDWALELSEEDRPQSVEEWREKILASTLPTTTPSIKKEPGVQWSFINMAAVAIILLLFATLTLLWRDNLKLEHKLRKEEVSRQELEKQLRREQQRRQEIEINYQHAKTLITKIREFNIQSLDESAHFNSEIQHYAVTNVELDDVLNVREFPGRFNQSVGNIPSTEKCIKFLGHYRLLGTQVWVEIRHQDVQGWVNSYYLMENSGCHQQR